jgi:hypothetical protein
MQEWYMFALKWQEHIPFLQLTVKTIGGVIKLLLLKTCQFLLLHEPEGLILEIATI